MQRARCAMSQLKLGFGCRAISCTSPQKGRSYQRADRFEICESLRGIYSSMDVLRGL